MSDLIMYNGNCPRNVSKDAKYTVRSDSGGSVVALTYVTDDDEKWYATTFEHPELVAMVNNIKVKVTGVPHGSFYINEYKQVLVPAVSSKSYYLAGEYHEDLDFNFEGKILTGKSVDYQNNALSIGDKWVGPHPGIPYVLSAGGMDIKYTQDLRPDVTKEVKLSKIIGQERTKEIIKPILKIKGNNGGRFYVNEHCTVFAPVEINNTLQYIYIGQIELENWFPKPTINKY